MLKQTNIVVLYVTDSKPDCYAFTKEYAHEETPRLVGYEYLSSVSNTTPIADDKLPLCDSSLVDSEVFVACTTEHEGENLTRCPHCNYSSVRSKTLKQHIMSKLRGERPLNFHLCD